MKKMKSFLMLSVAWAIASTALADYTYRANVNTGPYSDGSGGEFIVTSMTDKGNPHLPGAHVFNTFCVETSEYFTPDTTYWAQINTKSVLTDDDLTNGVAWLYTHFRDGTLTGYDFDDSSSERKADAGELQDAIWYLMGLGGSGGAGNEFFDLVAAPGNYDWSSSYTETDDIRTVRILNLNTKSHGPESGAVQDQLMMIPVPGAVVLGVIGLAIVGAVAGKRRV